MAQPTDHMIHTAIPSAPDAAKRAREQATAYDSVFAPTPLELEYPDGTSETIDIPPHPNLRMLDDDQQEAYEDLLCEVETYDREDDIYIPESTLANGVVLPATTRPGQVKVPYRKDGQRIRPAYSIRVVQIALGADVYAKLRQAGLSAADVWRIWNQQGLDLSNRQEEDSKSNGSGSGMESVPR
jgi:hypothetical protein